TVADRAELVAARRAFLRAAPRGSPEAEPARAARDQLRSVPPHPVRPDEADAPGRPASDHHRAHARGPEHRKLPVGVAARGELASVAPPRLLGEAGATHPHDLERPRAEEGDVVALRQEPAAVGDQLLEILDRLPALLDGRERPAPARAADRPEPA